MQISLVNAVDARPITDAKVEISSTGEPDRILEVLNTDSSGQTESVELEAPPLEYSLEPGSDQPYSEYNLRISAPEFEPITISGAQILSGERALQNQRMEPVGLEQEPYQVRGGS